MELKLHQISKTFGPLKANDGIGFTFEEGRIYAILGENGAGKSTLMKIIAGYQRPDPGGDILIDGQAVALNTPSEALAHGIGMLYQDPLDFSAMTVLENYLTARPQSGFIPDRKAARAELSRLAARFGFRIDPDAYISSLTIGERQQLEMVRLLSLNICFLILDEPTTGISEEQRGLLFASLRQLAQEDRLTIVLVTHKLADVEELCDEVLVLRAGRVAGMCPMPTPAAELVRMMFGQAQDPLTREIPHPDSHTRSPIMEIQHLDVHTRLMSVPDMTLTIREGEVIGLAGLDGSGQVDFMRACAGLTRISWQDHLMSFLALIGLLLLFDYVLGYSDVVFRVGAALALLITLTPFLNALWQNFVNRRENIRYQGKPIRWLSYRNLRARGLAYLSSLRLEEGLVSGMSLTEHFALAKRSLLPFVNWWAAFQEARRGIHTYQVRGQTYSPIQTLSGGNQQRVALALLPDNLRLIFLDNPTRGLDVNSARHIWTLMLARREQGTAVVFSSPDLDEIVAYSDRVIVFAGGRWQLVENRQEMNSTHLGWLIGGGRAATHETL